MFRKLRNKFLLLNLVMISIVMLISFSIIYFMTYQNVERDTLMRLYRISDFGKGPNQNRRPNPDMPPPPDFSASFNIETDSEGNIININSVYDINNEVYLKAVSIAWKSDKDISKFTLEGTRWLYQISPYKEGYRIVFLDITTEAEILIHLIYTFLFVGVLTLVLIFFISLFFANKAIAPIENAWQKQKQFVADASHELKTPLTTINTNVDVLLANSGDTIQQQSKWLHYIKAEAERMTHLTNDLLYLARVDDASSKMIYSEFNFSDVVNNMLLTMEAVIYEKSINLSYEIEPDMIISGNIEQIKQLIMIILDNAIKYTNENGNIDVALKRESTYAVLKVMNTGEGIAASEIDKIFDRFYRADKSRARKTGGYGLGLAIAKAITEQHNGKIKVRSELGKSTTFSVQFPLIQKS